jgi:hypothetical protein
MNLQRLGSQDFSDQYLPSPPAAAHTLAESGPENLLAPLLRKQFIGINGCVQGYYVYYLTRLTVVLPDKGEIELRDDLFDGAPVYAGCVSTFVENRGQRWHATDGSGVIFISDNANGVVNNDLTGTLITPDGMRYRFQNAGGYWGRCVSITDRNGNQITINRYTDPLNPAHITTDYTDQLGRTVKVEANVADPANPSVTLALLVTIKGYLATTQYYKVKTDFLSNNIRADFGYTGGWIVTGNTITTRTSAGCRPATRYSSNIKGKVT